MKGNKVQAAKWCTHPKKIFKEIKHVVSDCGLITIFNTIKKTKLLQFKKYGFQVQSLYSSNVSKQLSHLKGVFPKGQILKSFLNKLTNPTILLPFNKTDSYIQFKTIKMAQ